MSSTSDINLQNLVADVWDFDLKPNTTYLVVLDEGLIFPARIDDYKIKLKDTTNDRICLSYTTPEVLEVPAKIEATVDSDMGEMNKIGTVSFALAKYSFENEEYSVKLAVENPTAVFSDGTTQTVVPITYDPNTSVVTAEINRPLEAGKEYSLKIPANTFVPSANENLAAVSGNEEIALNFKGKATEIETVALSYVINGEFALKTFVEKGKPASFEISPIDDLWVVNNVENATLENGKYVTPVADNDLEVKVDFAFAKEVDFDFSTGIGEVIDGCKYKVFSDGDGLMIEGVASGDHIRIYTVGGSLVADRVVPDGMDIVRLSLPSDFYIIAINETTIKIRH